MNFYAVLGFFPVMLQTLYPPDPIQIGIRGLGYPLPISEAMTFVMALLGPGGEAAAQKVQGVTPNVLQGLDWPQGGLMLTACRMW